MSIGHEDTIGKALAFYAEFPAEILLVAYNDEPDTVFQTYFSSKLSQEEFSEMKNQTENVLDEAYNQATQIIDLCSDMIQKGSFTRNTQYLSKPDKVKRQFWGCKFRVRNKYQKSAQTREFPIYFGFSFAPSDDTKNLLLRSWLWVKRVNRETLKEKISSFDIQCSDYAPQKDTLYLSELNISDVVKNNENIESLINQLLKPIESIPPECWKLLLDLAKK